MKDSKKLFGWDTKKWIQLEKEILKLRGELDTPHSIKKAWLLVKLKFLEWRIKKLKLNIFH